MGQSKEGKIMSTIMLVNESGRIVPVVARCSKCSAFIGFYDVAMNVVSRLTYRRESNSLICIDCDEKNPKPAILNRRQPTPAST